MDSTALTLVQRPGIWLLELMDSGGSEDAERDRQIDREWRVERTDLEEDDQGMHAILQQADVTVAGPLPGPDRHSTDGVAVGKNITVQ